VTPIELLIELIQHVGIIYKSATPEIKRRMLELVLSNNELSDGSIGFKIKKSFDFLSHLSLKTSYNKSS
jgi:hypothetical protein